jgi:hypothetical protein
MSVEVQAGVFKQRSGEGYFNPTKKYGNNGMIKKHGSFIV